MTQGERWGHIRDLFERALDIDPSQRHAWVETAAAGDRDLAAEVESLLAHHGKAGSFLAEPPDALSSLMRDQDVFEPGERVGVYTIEEEIGRGGMGRVYRARDTRLGRVVALKALAPGMAIDAWQRDRLHREARAAAALSHPGICTIYALEEIDDELFIVTEYVDGETLRTEMEAGVPASERLESVARQLAAALAHAHSRGVTHRDLKPENVMRTRDGALKILDFGLAVIDAPGPDGERRLTEPGVLVGTAAYMSPEQLNGSVVDARSDVFSCGVLLYEYACGTHPYIAPTPLATMARILEGTHEPIAERCPSIAPAIGAVIERCLEKSPAGRFANGADLLRALGEPAGSYSTMRPMAFWWRAHQLIAIALYFAACLAAWQMKEWLPGPATALFVVTAAIAAAAGIVRGHLLFTERLNRARLRPELVRAGAITAVADLLLAAATVATGLLMSTVQPLAGVLAIALGAGIAVARTMVEPATTAAAFAP